MIFKIVFNKEIHRIRAKISTFQELLEAIANRLPQLQREAICCDYKDLDGDHVRINCQEDFSILKEELDGQKSVKIFVREDLNQTLQLPSQVSQEAVEIVEVEAVSQSFHEEPKPESPKRKEPVLMTLVLPEEMKAKMLRPEIAEEVTEEISLDKEPSETQGTKNSDSMTKEDWCAQMKEFWAGKSGKCGKPWKKKWGESKRKWWREKFNKKFDEAIQRALPQIAVHVAQILRKGDSMPVEALAPMRDSKTQDEQSKVVHHGYICDGCGMSPIVGVCYKSSVVKDFDFCEKCEATIPHPHAFLKLKTPEQRPHALMCVVNEEGKPAFNPKKHMPEMMKHAKGMFKQMFCNKGDKSPKETEKDFQKCFDKLSKFIDLDQFKAMGFDPKDMCKMMAQKGNKNGQKNFQKMMDNGKKFMKKFMKKCHKNVKGKKGPCPYAGMFNPFTAMMQQFGGFGGCPMKKDNKSKKPAEAMTYEEQIAHAMKLSMADVKKPKKEETPKPVKETKNVCETPNPETPKTETPKSVNKMSFEEQLAAAMKLSLQDTKTSIAKPVKLEDDVVIMIESSENNSDDDEDLYSDGPKETKTEEPKKVVKVEEVDPVVLANTAQLMAICGVPEEREGDVQKWVEVKAKSGHSGINELLNLFLDEMSGRF